MSRWFPDGLLLRLGDDTRPATLESMLASFETELDRRAARPGTRLTCLVGGGAVRYRVVPWREALSSPSERQAFAAHCFQEAYGDGARGWNVRQHTTRYGRATLASAIDGALLDRLEALALARRLRLVSVQPSLMHAFNVRRHGIGRGLFWFVWIEAHWITALLVTALEPLHVKQLPSSHADAASLLAREWFALGMEATPCPAYMARAALATPAAPSQVDPATRLQWPLIELTAVDDESPMAGPRAAADLSQAA